MVHIYSNLPLEKMLLQLMTEDNPTCTMCKWLCEKLMEAEMNAKINATKSEWIDGCSGYQRILVNKSLLY
ncbi:hypothetical protein EDC37_1228 [Pectinatus cerevisiiphilus]|uniref:Uncharacterized protein n=1 Tax=Pectinatus cerevisiiphilus TaxID=86956 RepID=A0A4R3K2E0_9FIRM|nr:hypothetical protein EDC37_1228 [Pectinatus cerevisiiphilus]